MKLWIPGKPIPFQRTGYNRATGRFYQHPGYKEWKEQAGWILKRHRLTHNAVSLDIEVQPDGMAVWVTDLEEPHLLRKTGMRGDLDNYGKALLDAANGLLYEDDRQVVELTQQFKQP